MNLEPESFVFGGLAILVVALVGFGIWAGLKESERWDAFSSAHHCKVVGKIDSSTGVGIGPVIGGNGQASVATVFTVIPGKTGYLCDDGVTYWRSN